MGVIVKHSLAIQALTIQAADVLRECTLDLSANDFLSGLFGKRQADNDRDNTPEIPTMDIDDEGLRGGAFQYDRKSACMFEACSHGSACMLCILCID